MNTSKTQIIIDMITELEQEKKELRQKIQENNDYIKEEEKYIHSISEKEDIEYKVFSPRAYESQYQKEIDQISTVIHTREEENRNIYRRCNRIQDKIDQLKIVGGSNIQYPDDNSDDVTLSVDDVLDNESTDSFGENDIWNDMIQYHEEQRKEISHELHDKSVQDLISMIHKIELCGKYMDTDIIRARLELATLQNNLKKTISQINDVIFRLYPLSLDDLGFFDALRRIPEQVKRQYGNTQIDIQCREFYIKNNDLFISLYHIIYETIQLCVRFSDEEDRLDVHVGKQMNSIVIEIDSYQLNDNSEWIKNRNRIQEKNFVFIIGQIELVGGSIHISDGNIRIVFAEEEESND